MLHSLLGQAPSHRVPRVYFGYSSLPRLSGGCPCLLFLREADSFRAFPKSIAKVKLFPEVAAALTEAHARHLLQLEFVLAAGRKSVRNRIAHYEFVSAGSVNLTANGFFLVGGPENISWPPGSKTLSLNQALGDRLDSLHACVDDMIDTFLKAVGTDQPREAEQAEIKG